MEGARHAMVTPTQIDKYAHLNISSIGNYAQPKVQLLELEVFQEILLVIETASLFQTTQKGIC